MVNRFPPAVFLMGPTASGKSALAVQLAQTLNGEIISVDSALVYCGMDIGTAKPTLAEQGGIPHYLLDILDPAEPFSTGQFRKLALAYMAEISRRGKLPILVGGTMLYFNALLQGLAVLPEADPAMRAQLDDELRLFGKEAMHARLAQVDPQAAARIHPNDPQRIQRALEVYRLSGRPLSSFFAQAAPDDVPYRKIKLIVAPGDRKILHEKIALRFHRMIEQGLIEEVRGLMLRGDLDAGMPSIRAVGYRQVWSYLQGEYDLATLTEKGIAATRQLAKRQFTWLRRERDAVCLQSESADLCEQAMRAIKSA